MMKADFNQNISIAPSLR